MRKPEFITFTGLDGACILNKDAYTRMVLLGRKYPIEWGVLFGGSIGEKRYVLPELAQALIKTKDQKFSAHLCGRYAKDFMKSNQIRFLEGFHRIQVNAREYSPWDLECIVLNAKRVKARPVIQVRDHTKFPPNHSDQLDQLFDQSGGKGRSPNVWPPHPGEILTGYAGGIGPDNVIKVLEQIASDGPYWIDMESKIRDEHDQFDLNKVQAVCQAVYD